MSLTLVHRLFSRTVMNLHALCVHSTNTQEEIAEHLAEKRTQAEKVNARASEHLLTPDGPAFCWSI